MSFSIPLTTPYVGPPAECYYSSPVRALKGNRIHACAAWRETTSRMPGHGVEMSLVRKAKDMSVVEAISCWTLIYTALSAWWIGHFMGRLKDQQERTWILCEKQRHDLIEAHSQLDRLREVLVRFAFIAETKANSGAQSD